eukprot:6193140-Pleurochrysis_carterae.AAC.1
MPFAKVNSRVRTLACRLACMQACMHVTSRRMQLQHQLSTTLRAVVNTQAASTPIPKSGSHRPASRQRLRAEVKD